MPTNPDPINLKAKADDALLVVEEAAVTIAELIDDVRRACRGVLDEAAYYRLDRGVLAHIETALSNDHTYLGGNMHTLADTIAELHDATLPACRRCGSTEFERPEDRDYVACADCGEKV